MQGLTRRSSRVLGAVIFCAGLWPASQWWEKGLASAVDAPYISPNGCYRVQLFKPFWVLPGMFHTHYHPDPAAEPIQYAHWEVPGFYRLYDQRNGRLLGESRIYDLADAGGPLKWGFSAVPWVSAGMIQIGPNLPDCIGDKPAPGR